MPLRDLEIDLRAVELELRQLKGSVDVAGDICNSFLVRLNAALQVTAARVDYYMHRVRTHQEALQAAADFAQLFCVDVAFHTDLEDYSESLLLDGARVAAARESVRDLLRSEVQRRAVSMKALLATLFRCPGEQPAKEGVRWLRRNAAVWVAPPYAYSHEAVYEKKFSKTQKVQRRPRPARDYSFLEDGYSSDSALECRRGMRSPYQPSTSGSPGRSPPVSGASSPYLSGAAPAAPSGPTAEAVAGPSTAGEPASSASTRRSSRRLSADVGAGSPRTEDDRSYFDVRPRLHSCEPTHSTAVLLNQLGALHAYVCNALEEHAGRLAVLATRSDRRARQLGGAYVEVADAEHLLRIDLQTGARDAVDELHRGRDLLYGCSRQAQVLGAVVADMGQSGWWHAGSQALPPQPMSQRVAGWWRSVARSLKRPGDHTADIMVSRLMPRD